MNTTPVRLDREFANMLKKLKVERIKKGIDTEQKSDRRLSKAIARYINSDMRAYETLLNSELENDKKTRRRR